MARQVFWEPGGQPTFRTWMDELWHLLEPTSQSYNGAVKVDMASCTGDTTGSAQGQCFVCWARLLKLVSLVHFVGIRDRAYCSYSEVAQRQVHRKLSRSMSWQWQPWLRELTTALPTRTQARHTAHCHHTAL